MQKSFLQEDNGLLMSLKVKYFQWEIWVSLMMMIFIYDDELNPKGALTPRTAETPRTPGTPKTPPVGLGLTGRGSTQGRGTKIYCL